MICLIWKFIIISLFFGIIIQFIYYNNRKSRTTIKNIISNKESNFPKVSVIIPVYNSANYLSQCLDSILNQTLKEIEIICVDDGSTDDSLSILNKYSKLDNRIKILKQNNKGGGIARNYGMSVAKGKYLSFLDSDDFFDENLLNETVNAAENNLADIVIFQFQTYNTTNDTYNNISYSFKRENFPNNLFNYHSNPKDFFQSFNPAPWNKLFLHSFIKKNGLYFQDNKRANDLYFTMTSFVSAQTIYFVNKVLIYYRIGQLNNCQSTNSLYPFDFYKALIAIKQFLKKKNIFSKLKETYKKLAKFGIIYNLNQDEEKNILVYEELKREGFKNLEIDFIPTKKISMKFHEKYEKYMDNIYFRHINIVNENYEITIFKKGDYLFKPKVSVIILIYNVEKYIIQCLESISKQTLKEIEIICVDDGSTDNSLNKIKKFAVNDNRIQIISQINRGKSVAKNSGVKYSNGEYIYFIDGDGYLELNALLDLYNNATQNNLDIILFDAVPFSDENNPMIEEQLQFYTDFYSRKYNYSMILNGSEMFLEMIQNEEYRPYICLQFYKKKFYINKGLSFFPGILHEDILFSLFALLNANKTNHIKQNYYKYRVHINSLTNTYNINNAYGYLIIYCEIQKLMENYHFDYQLKSAIIKEISAIEEKILKTYKILSKEEKKFLLKKITIYQEIQFKSIIQLNELMDLNKKIKKLKKKNKISIYIIFILLIILLISIINKFFIR